ncbi:MAG: DNA alkylation repair protein [Tissierellia bacterium]|nr:DNA alkylation repair protein [Tissierellia bacterium]
MIEALKALQDLGYKSFTEGLIPTLDKERILGVRMPAIRSLGKSMMKEEPEKVYAFLQNLPHGTYDENQLHAVFINEEREYQRALDALYSFLPHVDNWATCDVLSPKVFQNHRQDLLPHIRQWMGDEREYVCRFGIKMLMEHFLGEQYDKSLLYEVANIDREDYYVKMMVAWFFSMVLVHQYEDGLEILKEGLLSKWIHDKTIQKAVESRRIPAERKEALRALRK